MRDFKSSRRRFVVLSLALSLMSIAGPASAATAITAKAQAAAVAMQAYPGQVVSEKLTKAPNGSPVYMVKIQGSQGTRSITVDANTGEVVRGGATRQSPGRAPSPGGAMPPGAPASGGGGY